MTPIKNRLKYLNKIIPANIWKNISNYITPIDVIKKINYSKDWYEDIYHSNHDFDKFFTLEQDKYKHFKKRLYDVLKKCNINKKTNINWLDPACNNGKTPIWASKKLPLANFYMFDFSKPIIEWLKNYDPIPRKSHI